VKLYKTDAVVLKTINMRDADQLIVLFSRVYGKLRVLAHGSRKPISRKRGFIQPFCYSRFLIYKGKEMDSISQCEGLEVFPDLLKDLSILSYACYLTELVENLTAEGEANENVFALLLQSLRMLAQVDKEIMARSFESKLVNYLGYRPVLEHCVACRRELQGGRVGFAAALGGVLCSSCAEKTSGLFWCHRGTVETLKQFLRWDLSRLGNLKVSAQAKKELHQILKIYLEYHLGYRRKNMNFVR